MVTPREVKINCNVAIFRLITFKVLCEVFFLFDIFFCQISKQTILAIFEFMEI